MVSLTLPPPGAVTQGAAWIPPGGPRRWHHRRMAFPGAHSLLVLAGPLFTEERWSIGLRLSRVGPGGSQQIDEDRAAPIFDAIATFWAGNFGVGRQAALDLIKLNTIGPDGKYLQPYTVLRELSPVVASGGTPSPFPPQVSCVVTLETGQNRGLAARGRVFLPAPMATVQSDGRMAVADRDAISAGARALVNTINTAASPDRVIVASDVREGAIRQVTAVSVGLVLDTMRSRRTSLQEDRASVVVQAPT